MEVRGLPVATGSSAPADSARPPHQEEASGAEQEREQGQRQSGTTATGVRGKGRKQQGHRHPAEQGERLGQTEHEPEASGRESSGGDQRRGGERWGTGDAEQHLAQIAESSVDA